MDFNFGNACMHFARTGAPRGFTWKYLLSYLLGMIVFFAVFLALFAEPWSALMLASISGDQAAADAAALENLGGILLAYAFLLPASLVFWSIFEASFQRRYVRADKFRLRLGSDEFRLMAVGLLWFLFFIAMYLIVAIFLSSTFLILASASDNPMIVGVISFIIGFAGLAFWAFLAVRLSAASALTIRHREIRFASSWEATKGRFWTLLGSYLLLAVVAIVVYFVVAFIMVTLMTFFMAGNAEFIEAANSGAESDPAVVLAMFSSPGFIIAGGTLYLVLLLLQAWFGVVWAGPAALAARTSGGEDTPANRDAEVFS